MLIRPAAKKDVPYITKLADSIKIDYKNPQKNGFLVYVLNKSKYGIRQEVSKFFYVAEENKKIIGFLMCYDNFTLEELLKNKELNHEDSICNFILNQKGPYIFGDQIGISNNKTSQGVGLGLINKLIEDMKKEDIKTMYVCILHKPVFNKASFNFCKKIGFKKVAEITNSDKHIWGIYKLELK